MAGGLEDNVMERFTAGGAAAENISFVRDTYRFTIPAPPGDLVAESRAYSGPTMNAFDAAEADGRAAELAEELVTLFNAQNDSPDPATTSIPAPFLRVTVAL